MPSSDEYRIMVEQAPVMLWRCDARGARDYCNERWLAFTGRTLQEDLGDRWVEALHTEDVAACVAAFRGALQAGRPFEVEYRLRRRDGVYRWVLERGVPLRDGQGRLTGFLASCVDVTPRVLAERERASRNAAQVRLLHGLLPICPGCDQIRGDPAYWQRVEGYAARSEAAFRECLCPTCQARLFPASGAGR